jgi:hypothetical protein
MDDPAAFVAQAALAQLQHRHVEARRTYLASFHESVTADLTAAGGDRDVAASRADMMIEMVLDAAAGGASQLQQRPGPTTTQAQEAHPR